MSGSRAQRDLEALQAAQDNKAYQDRMSALDKASRALYGVPYGNPGRLPAPQNRAERRRAEKLARRLRKHLPRKDEASDASD